MRVLGVYPPARNESKEILGFLGRITCALSTDHCLSRLRFECEHSCWDPKDGELFLSRTKSGKTLMEFRSDSNVQIYRRTWV